MSSSSSSSSSNHSEQGVPWSPAETNIVQHVIRANPWCAQGELVRTIATFLRQMSVTNPSIRASIPEEVICNKIRNERRRFREESLKQSSKPSSSTTTTTTRVPRVTSPPSAPPPPPPPAPLLLPFPPVVTAPIVTVAAPNVGNANADIESEDDDYISPRASSSSSFTTHNTAKRALHILTQDDDEDEEIMMGRRRRHMTTPHPPSPLHERFPSPPSPPALILKSEYDKLKRENDALRAQVNASTDMAKYEAQLIRIEQSYRTHIDILKEQFKAEMSMMKQTMLHMQQRMVAVGYELYEPNHWRFLVQQQQPQLSLPVEASSSSPNPGTTQQ